MNIQPNLGLIESVSAYLMEELGDDFDAETFWDTLDGETDVVDVVDTILVKMHEDAAMADAIKAQIDAMNLRKKRFDHTAQTLKKTLKLVLDASGQRKIARPRGTVSIIKGRTSVEITDKDAVPTQLCKVAYTPDKTAIKAQIDAGEDVPGAQLVVGDDSVSVRVS